MANVALPTNAVDLEGLDALRRRAHGDDPAALARRGGAVRGVVHRHDARERAQRELGLRSVRRARNASNTSSSWITKSRSSSRAAAASASARCCEQLELASRAKASARARAAGAPQRTGAASIEPFGPHARRRRSGGHRAAASAEPGAGRVSTRLCPRVSTALGGARSREQAARGEPTPAQFVAHCCPKRNAAAAALGIEPRLAARASRARDGLGPRRAAARGRVREQPVRHQGRSVVARARPSRTGRSSTKTASTARNASGSVPTAARRRASRTTSI